MKIRKRTALIAGGAVVLVAAGSLFGWKVHEHRADEAFIAEQYAQLETDEEALAPKSDLGEKWAIHECGSLAPGFEYDDTKVVQNGSTGGVFLYAEDGDTLQTARCDAEWTGERWVISAH
ncbi:hypothetical protein ACTXM8_04715 [Brachybacterium alimentarium]|uniref:hypothetical protein n=1 Tax=Brachybacterium alimentarium TaxID=47845 RepID=UPI003FD2993D